MTSRGKSAQIGVITVADRLRQARRRRFVGRTGEIELFRTALTSDEPGFTVLFVYGPGGIGKTALLGALAQVAEEADATPVRLVARTIEPSPSAFFAALGAALGIPERAAPLESLEAHRRPILFIDTYEQLVPLDNWLREEFLPALPAAALVVAAGRTPPSPQWASDLGWGELLRVVALRNLQPDDARAYLHAAGVPEDLHGQVLEMTHGHPLALSLLVDVVEQHRGALAPGLSLQESPDVVRVLLEHFVEWVPSPRHREALKACAHARFTTEDLLRTALGGDDAHELFGWLRGLSFIEEDPYGVFPHDVARDVLDADLRWRDRASYAELHRRVRRHLVEQAGRTRGLEQHRWTADIIFLHRNNPAMSSFWDWVSFGQAFPDELRDEDRAPIVAMTRRHQGAEQAELVAHWMEHPAATFIAIRAGSGEPIGYGGEIALHQAGESDLAADRGVAAIWEYVQRHGSPRPGDSVYAARFFMDRDAYQRPSGSNNVITARHIQHVLTTPGLSWDFIAC
ncbi:hypothetical protein EV643_110261 [Kribbella sp. VKM Ac-2527]|uniref:Orc1-like AAA ATPase domain-containing protein n=1 Tax=Kribbella caucasensis TaxID=2512215 RepID=A0A4R6KBQ4_9ACTN|nr:ATP-binding protein [Kribbella sp. VKM Ac-2527]TDO46878.1 hypothetical protein EV643_110261 [Kribbella sp. VKM Ac-2527]